MKRTGMILSAIAVSALLISSCRKEPLNDMTEEESRIYVTNYNDTADFTSYKTFSIVDSVAVISNREDAKKELTAYDVKLLNSLKTSLQGRGYTLVDKGAKPDLAVNVSRIDNTTTSIGYDPGYWAGYPGYWDSGYWGYPGFDYWFPSYYSVFRTREKSVVVDLLDLKNAPHADNKLNAIWNAMLRGTGVWNSDNIESMVKAVIDQSAYLKASNN
ncbi:DUF4136 domain-containing protein [Chitinophaga sp. SYP-B3965]|uniref:DUF4136 domain-containing protein n=1 Tax=Chitinophaga sp. SYP-B3965 TaxID=2663120 RepID=UPI001299FDE1|nr:DUF4136 domain-containing protein [Chitinophaga sp. SYP-B3965]MRG45894.1 DUF4136 domain-containing protein [Chitinophaga sp. SYP-B3965]